MRSRLAVVVACFVTASALHAQTATAAAQQTITFNPIGLAAGFFNAEYERAVSPNYSLSAGASYFNFDLGIGRVAYSAADVRARYYPERALHGFSVGLSGGVIQTNAKEDAELGGGHHTNHGVTIGSALEYAWLLGHSERTAFSLGLGFKRVILIGGHSPDITTFYPTIRSSFGFAF